VILDSEELAFVSLKDLRLFVKALKNLTKTHLCKILLRTQHVFLKGSSENPEILLLLLFYLSGLLLKN
jgi:hypothetical protein